MALSKENIGRWLDTLPKGALVAIDDGGLCLQQLNGEAYLEVGGIPEDDDTRKES